MADALDLDALERAITGEDGLDPVPWVRAESVLIIIARCRAAEQRADNAEEQVQRVTALPRHEIRSSHEKATPSGKLQVIVAADLDAALATRAEATPERVILTEDPTTGATETAGGASTPTEDPAK